jgi:uncharacterized protein (DUF2062 family)
VDGLAYSLHRPMVCNRERGELCRMIGVALSRGVAVGGGAFPGVQSLWARIFNVVLTVQVPVRLNLTWKSSPLLGHAYPALELSW